MERKSNFFRSTVIQNVWSILSIKEFEYTSAQAGQIKVEIVFCVGQFLYFPVNKKATCQELILSPGIEPGGIIYRSMDMDRLFNATFRA